eukprot:jgi/Chrzof1/7301/Cz02g18120.t1
MSVGEFTASSINVEEDKRGEKDDQKESQLDLDKFKQDVAANVQLSQQGKLHEALEGLLTLEKTARLAEDVTASKASCSAILDACYQAKEWKLLEEQVVLLAKRRGQLKQVIQAFVRQAMGYLDHTPDKEVMVSLISTLQTVTEGKIFVEIERARLTRKLAKLKEQEGNIAEAADILQEVPVETFGAMAKTEKIAFILEQVRLCLAKKDFIRAQILSRKISPRAFVARKGESKGEIGIEGTAIEEAEEGVPTLPELKHRYYELMIEYHLHYNNYLEICRSYKALYDSETVQADAAQWTPVLKKICWYAVLAPTYSTAEGSSSDVLTLLTTTANDKKLSELPLYRQLLTTFQNPEIIRWNLFESQYGADMTSEVAVFAGEGGAKRREDLRLRVIEHNIMVVSKYYTRITITRLAELLNLPKDESEKHLSDLVVAKAVAAKIDRPAGLVVFGKHEQPEDVLNSWSSNISNLLELVEKSCQQIQKEAMVHKVQLGSAA